MSPVNLTSLAKGSLFTFRSENGEHQSVIDYIFVPNLSGNLTWVWTLLRKGKSIKTWKSPKTMLIVVVEMLMKQLRKLDAREV